MAEFRDARNLAYFRGLHSGGSCVIMASGPSLTREQTALLAQSHTTHKIGMNRSYEWLWPDYHVIQDKYWETQPWRDAMDRMDKENRLFTKEGRPLGMQIAAKQKHLPMKWANWSWDLVEGVGPGNTAYVALQIAVYMGFRKIAFVGLDMRLPDPENPDDAYMRGKTHFFGRHHLTQDATRKFSSMFESFEYGERVLRQAGVNVVNCSPGSALHCFAQADLEEFLEQAKLEAAIHG